MRFHAGCRVTHLKRHEWGKVVLARPIRRIPGCGDEAGLPRDDLCLPVQRPIPKDTRHRPVIGNPQEPLAGGRHAGGRNRELPLPRWVRRSRRGSRRKAPPRRLIRAAAPRGVCGEMT